VNKTAELIEMVPFGPRNRMLDGRAHWRHLANTVERLCGGGCELLGMPLRELLSDS